MAPRKTVKVDAQERTEICKECRFSHYKRGEEMRCRRYPPTHVYDVATGLTAVQWPEVDSDMYCGEFRAKLSS